MAQIPQHLTNFNVYGGPKANVFLGVAKAELPSFQSMTDTVEGAGIAGQIESPIIGHFASQVLKVSFRTVNRDQLSMLAPVSQRLALYGAIQVKDTAVGLLVVQQLVVECSGMLKNLVLGSLEPGKVMGSEFDQEVDSITVRLDGLDVIELDKQNQIFKVMGFDYMASVRRATGGV